jgi:hypothetical protein
MDRRNAAFAPRAGRGWHGILPGAGIVASSVLVLLASWAAPAAADLPPIPGSVLGGNVQIGGRGALTLAMGWPSTYIRYDFRTSETFGLGLRADFYYGHPSFGFSYGLGTGFSVPMRIQVFERDRWTVAISIRPGFYLGVGNRWFRSYHTDTEYRVPSDAFYFGVIIEPGARVGLQVTEFLNVVFGADLGVHVVIVAPADMETVVEPVIPFTLMGGVELALSRSITTFFYTHVGPAFGAAAHCHRWEGPADNQQCANWDYGFHAAFAGQFYLGFSFYF